jgi:hypothetical protein
LENQRVEQVLLRGGGGQGFGGKVAQIMWTHVSKCENNKIKFENKNTSIKMRNHIFYSQSVYEENYLNPCDNIHKSILKLYIP